MNTEEPDQSVQDGGGGDALGVKALIVRGLFIAVSGGGLSGLIFRFLNQFLGLPETGLFSVAVSLPIVCVILLFEPRTIRDFGLMILVATVSGASALLVSALLSMHFVGVTAPAFGAGLGAAFGISIVLLARSRLGITESKRFQPSDPNTTPHP